MRVVWASLKKEIREVLRDKRTLLLTILIPLGFYPAMSLMTADLQKKQDAKLRDRVYNVGISGWGDEEKMKELNQWSSDVVWVPLEREAGEKLLTSRKLDAFVETEIEMVKGYEQRKLTLHYYSSGSGSISYLKIREAIAMVTALEVTKRMKGKEHLLTPVAIVKETDHASARAISGSKYGGMGAYFIVFLAFTGCMAVAVDTAAGEKERGTLEAILATPGTFMGVACGKLLYIIIMGMISVLSTVGGIVIMVLGSGGDEGFKIADVGFVSLIGIAVLLVTLVLFFAAILFSFSTLAKSNKEAHVRSSMLMIVVAMTLVYCIIPGVELTSKLLWVPILNAAMSIRELWSGGMSVTAYFQVLAILLVLSALVLWWITKKVNADREKVLLKQ